MVFPGAFPSGNFGRGHAQAKPILRRLRLRKPYAIWSGLGIVLISISSLLLYDQKLGLAALLGIGLIIAGVMVIQLFSGSSGH